MNLFDEEAFEAALVGAVRSGASGERELIGALASARDEDRATGIVSALGEADGPDGVAVLRNIIARPVDPLGLRTTALVALAKRQGPAASDVLRVCLLEEDQATAAYALVGLAGVGDDRAWPEVFRWLSQALDELEPDPDPDHDFDDRTLAAQSDIAAAIAYLARHSASDRGKQQPVVALLRSRWNRLRGAEQRWLTVHWPASDPAQAESFTVLDATWIADWISGPVFEAIYTR